MNTNNAFLTRSEYFYRVFSDLWRIAKPHLKTLADIIIIIPTPYTKLNIALRICSNIIRSLDKFSNSESANELKTTIENIFTRYGRDDIDGSFYDTQKSKKNQAILDKFIEENKNINDNLREDIFTASILNKLVLAKGRFLEYTKGREITDFDHLMRVKAIQEVIHSVEESISKTNNELRLSSTEQDLIDIINKLSENTRLSDKENIKLNDFFLQRFGKELRPYVFEKIITGWSQRLYNLNNDWDLLSRETARLKTKLQRLEFDVRHNPNNTPLQDEYQKLHANMEEKKHCLHTLAKNKRQLSTIIFAAQGLLEIMEDSEIIKKRPYLRTAGESVAQIIVECAEGGKTWEMLTLDQANSIIDFANIFEEIYKQRNRDYGDIG